MSSKIEYLPYIVVPVAASIFCAYISQNRRKEKNGDEDNSTYFFQNESFYRTYFIHSLMSLFMALYSLLVLLKSDPWVSMVVILALIALAKFTTFLFSESTEPISGKWGKRSWGFVSIGFGINLLLVLLIIGASEKLVSIDTATSNPINSSKSSSLSNTENQVLLPKN